MIYKFNAKIIAIVLVANNFAHPQNSSYLSYLRFAPNDLLQRRLCIPR